MAYPPFYSSSTPPFYTTSTAIPVPLSNPSFSHGYTPPSPNPYTSSSTYSTPYGYDNAAYLRYCNTYQHQSIHPHSSISYQPGGYHISSISPMDFQKSMNELLQASQQYTNEFIAIDKQIQVSEHSIKATFQEMLESLGDLAQNFREALKEHFQEDEEDSQELIADDKKIPIAAPVVEEREDIFLEVLTDQDSTEQDPVVEEQQVPVTKVFKTLDPPTPVPDRSVPATNERDETLQAPPPMFQMLPQVASYPKTWPSLPPQVDAVPTNRFPGLRFCDYFILLTPDLVHPSHSEDFVSQNAMSSSAKTLELAVTIFVFETENTTAKTNGNPILVFDPGGILTNDHASDVRRRLCNQMFQKRVARTITVATPPPHRSILVFDPGGSLTVNVRHREQCLTTPLL